MFYRNVNNIDKDCYVREDLPLMSLKCPKCEHLLLRGSLLSANNIGADLYSDGKQIGLMMRDFPEVTICEKCNTIFWLKNSELMVTVKEAEKKKLPVKNATDVRFLTIAEYFRALELKISETTEAEIYLRQYIFWTFNDRLRNSEELFNSEEEKILWNSNIIRLIEILDPENSDQKILLADLHRTLGNFEKCMELIESVENENLRWLKNGFRNECAKNNKNVFVIPW